MFQVAEMVLERGTIQMGLVVVLVTGGRGDLEYTMEGWVKEVTHMVALIFLVSWEVEVKVLMYLMPMSQEGEWLVRICAKPLKFISKENMFWWLMVFWMFLTPKKLGSASVPPSLPLSLSVEYKLE